MSDREKALKRVQMYTFAMIDSSMFLDSHPNNREALEYFKRHKKLADEARREYVSKYGPITMNDVDDNATNWTWVKGPWPWEGTK